MEFQLSIRGVFKYVSMSIQMSISCKGATKNSPFELKKPPVKKNQKNLALIMTLSDFKLSLIYFIYSFRQFELTEL